MLEFVVKCWGVVFIEKVGLLLVFESFILFVIVFGFFKIFFLLIKFYRI